MSSAIISACGMYRYRLDRNVQASGPVYAYFGINPSTADASRNDATVRKWIGFTKVFGGSRFVVGNVFAYRTKDVKVLAAVEDPFGDDIGDHVTDILGEADILVPCWGNISKVPPKLQYAFDVLLDSLLSSGKPVRHFGLTKSGDPKHPQMLGYKTPLIPWPTNPEQNAAKMAQAIRVLLEDMQTPAYRDRLRFIASDAFARYQAFIAAGFNEGQALALTIGKP